ncbi:hypothetical protein LCL85_00040 [Vibrio alginolyticus]|nr:hypothetical protein [Vibrio alginolyticus]
MPTDVVVLGKTVSVNGYVSDEDDTYWALDGNDLLDKLYPVLETDVHEYITPYFKDTKVVNSTIESVGWKSSYYLDELKLELSIPIDLTKARDIQFQNYTKTTLSGYTTVEPEMFSGSFNIYTTHTQNINKLNDFTDTIALRASMTLGGIILEDGHTYYYNSRADEHNFQRDATRFLYQGDSETSLWQFGDYISQSEIVSLGTGDIFGLAYSYQPKYLKGYRQGNSVPVVLESPSLVKISINGEVYREIRLATGQYNLKDLPVNKGTNEVRLEYTDQLGVVTQRYLNIINRPELLRRGDFETQLVGGVEQEYVEGEKKIYREKTSGQAMLAYGFHDRWTGSVWGEWLEDEKAAGILQSVALGKSLFTLDLSSLQHDNIDSYRVNSTFYFPDLFFNTLRDINLSHSYTHTIDDGNLSPDQNTLYFSTGITAPSSLGYFSFSSGVEWLGDSHQRTYASLNTRYIIFDKIYTSLNFRWEDSIEDSNKFSAYFSLSIPLGGGDYSLDFRSSYDTDDEEVESTLSASKYDVNDYWRGSINLVDKKYDSASLLYRSRQTKINTSAKLTSSKESSSDPLRTLQIGVETGLAWAGNNVSITSPINGGFALVSLSDNFDNYALKKDRYNRINIVPEDEGGSDVILIPVNNNSQRLIKVNSENLDFNEEIENSRYVAHSKLRQGSSIILNKLSGFFITGNLINGDSQPLVDVVGEIKSVSSGETYPFFTDDNGNFELDMVVEGEYTVSLYKGGQSVSSFKVLESNAVEGVFIEVGEVIITNL